MDGLLARLLGARQRLLLAKAAAATDPFYEWGDLIYDVGQLILESLPTAPGPVVVERFWQEECDE